VAVPVRNAVLWELFLQKFKLGNIDLKTMPTESEESSLIETLRGSDAVFADIRFLMPSQHTMGGGNEHLDLIVSESYSEFPAIRKLIEVLHSDEFAMWVESNPGCSVRSRGLVSP
ncbi:MAG: hypothetical protein L0287_08275, partial [Anaerolineae bacterium]|nr:hypothetical protein [Anaerolineae bacterium]